jgi:hypothetical protein
MCITTQELTCMDTHGVTIVKYIIENMKRRSPTRSEFFRIGHNLNFEVFFSFLLEPYI